MASYGLFIGRDLLDYTLHDGPKSIIIADTETEVWQHIFDRVAAHLAAGANDPELGCAADYRRLLEQHPPTTGTRADPSRLREWLNRCDGYAEVFYLVFAPDEVEHLPSSTGASTEVL
jgi:hypothetical protein